MKAVKIVHLSDAHLGANMSFLDPSSERIRKNELLATFKKAVSVCADEQADLFLICGDLFDSNNPDKLTVTTVIKAFESIPNTAVFLALGDHDFMSIDSFYGLSIPENVHVFPSEWECITIDGRAGINVFGISFDRSHITEPLLRAFPRGIFDNSINIMLMHGDLLQNEDGSSLHNPIYENLLAEIPMDYVALGHRHKRTALKVANGTTFAYSGCPEGISFDDIGERGVYVGEISKGKLQLKFVPICKRQFVALEVDISSCQITSDICVEILNKVEKDCGAEYGENIYKITLTGRTNMYIDLAHIKSIMMDKFFYCELKNCVKTNINIQSLARENTIQGIFAKNMLKYLDKNGPSEEFNRAVSIGLKALDGEVFDSDNQPDTHG